MKRNSLNLYGDGTLSIIQRQLVLEGFSKINRDLFIIVLNEHTDITCVNNIGGRLSLIYLQHNKGMVSLNKNIKVENKISLKGTTEQPDYRIKLNCI